MRGFFWLFPAIFVTKLAVIISVWARPMQLSLFPDLPAGAQLLGSDRIPPIPDLACAGILLTRIRPERNEWRFYRLEL